MGQGVSEDYAEAMKWYRKAADQGNTQAQFELGSIYQWRDGVVPQDYAEAMKWYRKAANRGHAGAAFMLGGMYFRGRGVPQNHAEAMKWLRKAAAATDQRDDQEQRSVLLQKMMKEMGFSADEIKVNTK